MFFSFKDYLKRNTGKYEDGDGKKFKSDVIEGDVKDGSDDVYYAGKDTINNAEYSNDPHKAIRRLMENSRKVFEY